MTAWANGWLWVIAALLLAAAELVLPGYVFLGMAGAVLVMGLLLLSGVWTLGLPATLVVTAILSGLIWLLLSRMIGVDRSEVRVWKRDINDNDPQGGRKP